jgi:sec-independent protein translocase protein TatA
MEFFSNPLHLMLLIVVIVLLFGASKLGDVGGALGKSIREFKKEAGSDDAKPQKPAVPPANSSYVPPATQPYNYDQNPVRYDQAPPAGYAPAQPASAPRPDFAPADYRPGAPQSGVPAQPVNVPPDNVGR